MPWRQVCSASPASSARQTGTVLAAHISSIWRARSVSPGPAFYLLDRPPQNRSILPSLFPSSPLLFWWGFFGAAAGHAWRVRCPMSQPQPITPADPSDSPKEARLRPVVELGRCPPLCSRSQPHGNPRRRANSGTGGRADSRADRELDGGRHAGADSRA